MNSLLIQSLVFACRPRRKTSPSSTETCWRNVGQMQRRSKKS